MHETQQFFTVLVCRTECSGAHNFSVIFQNLAYHFMHVNSKHWQTPSYIMQDMYQIQIPLFFLNRMHAW